MRAHQFICEDTRNKSSQFVEMFEKFLPLAMKHIGLTSLPKIVFEKSVGDSDQPTFGKYVNGEHTLYVALANRHPNDILRTIAHELTHYRQDTEHQLDQTSGETGSPIENEANAVAGVVMRHFNKKYPEYLKVRPLIAENKISELFDPKSGFETKWNTKYASTGQVTVDAKDAAGRTIHIGFTPSGNGRVIDFDFFRGGSVKVTGQGDAEKVFATVISAMQEYLGKIRKPEYITFAGEGASRYRLYAALVKRYAPQWGYKLLNVNDYRSITDDDLEALGDFDFDKNRFFLKRADLLTTNSKEPTEETGSKLSELFSGGSKVHVIHADKWNFKTQSDNIHGRTIVFSADRSSSGNWDVEFRQLGGTDSGYAVTGAGGEIEVFNFVLNSIKELLARYSPESIEFMSSKLEPSRSKLYRRLLSRISKYAPGYQVSPEETFGNYVVFVISKI